MTNPLPSGVTVQVTTPGPPAIQLPIPTPTSVVVMPTPGIPGTLNPAQIEDITEDIEEGLEPPVDLTIVFENALQ